MNARRTGRLLSLIWTSAPLWMLGLLCSGAMAQQTARVSIDSTGGQADRPCVEPSTSGDGRFVAFTSSSTNLVSGDGNGVRDIFVHDRETATTTRVSVDSSGVEGNFDSARPSISADGRFVAFDSAASNLVPGDTNGHWDVFVHDRETATTTRVSVDSLGAQASANCLDPSISANGRFVVFSSQASDLIPGGNSTLDVYVHDRQSGSTVQVSVDSLGAPGNGGSSAPSISGDGQRVAFISGASNLVAGDTNGVADIFVHDRQGGTTTRVSVDSSGAQARFGATGVPSIAANGGFVAFESRSDDLVPGKTNNALDVFVHELQSGLTTRVSVDSSGGQGNGASLNASISANGGVVAFESNSTNLVSGAGGDLDIFAHDRQSGSTVLMSVDSLGAPANLFCQRPSISDDGRFVSFDSIATNLVPGDTNGLQDIFVHGLGLTLETDLPRPFAGDTLTLSTRGGQPSGPVILLVVDVNGTPFKLRLGPVGSFDAGGVRAVGGAVPTGLSGNFVTFMSLGLDNSAELSVTNRVQIAFQ